MKKCDSSPTYELKLVEEGESSLTSLNQWLCILINDDHACLEQLSSKIGGHHGKVTCNKSSSNIGGTIIKVYEPQPEPLDMRTPLSVSS